MHANFRTFLEFEPSAQNGLILKSRVLLDQIQPIEKSSILEVVGRFSADERDDTMAKIFWNFDRA